MSIFDQLPFILLMLFSASLSGAIAVRAYRSRRKVARAASFSMMALFGSLWMILVTLDSLLTSLPWREFLWWLIPLVILSTLMGLLFFSLEFSLRLNELQEQFYIQRSPSLSWLPAFRSPIPCTTRCGRLRS